MNDGNEFDTVNPVSDDNQEGLADRDAELAQRKQELLAELSQLVIDLQSTIPDAGADVTSPKYLFSYIQQSVGRLTPDVQLGILESFQGLTRDDLMDINTWKGLAFMLSYSTRFQAGQVKEKMNESLPPPLQPDTTIAFMQQSAERFSPEIARNLIGTFEGATREDLMDLDTWKGVWTMLNYSLRFQMNSLWDHILGNDKGEKYLE